MGKSKLEKPVAELIQLIFDFKMINSQLNSAGFDTKKMPLGKLSISNINKAFWVLNQLSQAIKNQASEDTLKELSSDFYTLMPHNIGWSNMSTMTIRNENTIKDKLELLESIRQVQAAYQLVYGSGDSAEGSNPIDENYEKLHCKIESVDKNVTVFTKIDT